MLTWVALLALALFSGATFFAARRKALVVAGGRLRARLFLFRIDAQRVIVLLQ